MFSKSVINTLIHVNQKIVIFTNTVNIEEIFNSLDIYRMWKHIVFFFHILCQSVLSPNERSLNKIKWWEWRAKNWCRSSTLSWEAAIVRNHTIFMQLLSCSLLAEMKGKVLNAVSKLKTSLA